MKIGLLSYPMLFQRSGGLQVQIVETAEALRQEGLRAELIDPTRTRLSEFDLIHVFSAINSNYRVIETARDQGVPTVVSPLLREHWSKQFARKARILELIVGRASGWQLRTQYREIAYCIEQADAIVALGELERNAIRASFGITSTVHVIPNGVPARFFAPDPAVFCQQLEIEAGFVLNVGSISPHKNQLTIARALAGTDLRLVLIGSCSREHEAYLEQVLAFPNVVHAGTLAYDHPALPSAYASASVFCLPSASEVMPLSVMEALAAGTPVVMTNRHGMSGDFRCAGLDFIDPDDIDGIRRLLLARAGGFDRRSDCVGLASRYSWQSVAKALVEVYAGVLREPASARGPSRQGDTKRARVTTTSATSGHRA